MQVSPSASLFQALSNLFQPHAAGVQGADGAMRAAGAEAARAPSVPKIDQGQAATRFEEPAPGTPIRRGMLINILT